MNLKAVRLWNDTCMAMVDHCSDIGLAPQGEGEDTEALAGLELAKRVLKLEAELAQLLKEKDR